MEAKVLAEQYGLAAQKVLGSVDRFGVRARGSLATEIMKLLGSSAFIQSDLGRAKSEKGFLPVIRMGTNPSLEGVTNPALLNIQFGGDANQAIDVDTMAVAISLKYLAAVLGQDLQNTSDLNQKMLAQLLDLKGASSALFSVSQNQFMIMPQAVHDFIARYRAELRMQTSA